MLNFKYSEALAELIKEYLDGEEMKYQFLDDLGVFRVPINNGGISGLLKYHIVVNESDYMISVQPTGLTVKISDEKVFYEFTRLLCLINYNLRFGCLSVDSRGDIRHRYSVECKNCLPSKEVIQHSFWSAAWCFNHYENVFYKVLTGQTSVPEIETNSELF